MSTIDDLRCKKLSLWQDLRMNKIELDLARQQLHAIEERRAKLKLQYQAIDRKLAFIDGRYHKVEKPKEQKQAKKDDLMKVLESLTPERIRRIAEALEGVGDE